MMKAYIIIINFISWILFFQHLHTLFFLFKETCNWPIALENGEVQCPTNDPPTVGQTCDVICSDTYATDQAMLTCEPGGGWSPIMPCIG